jgi:hypothetical protein
LFCFLLSFLLWCFCQAQHSKDSSSSFICVPAMLLSQFKILVSWIYRVHFSYCGKKGGIKAWHFQFFSCRQRKAAIPIKSGSTLTHSLPFFAHCFCIFFRARLFSFFGISSVFAQGNWDDTEKPFLKHKIFEARWMWGFPFL